MSPSKANRNLVRAHRRPIRVEMNCGTSGQSNSGESASSWLLATLLLGGRRVLEKLMRSRRRILDACVCATVMALLSACASHSSPIASTYKSSGGCCGPFPSWLVPHSGVDFTGAFGEDVIAPADGIIVPHYGANPETCGNTVAIRHAFDRYTVFCHFQEVSVEIGQQVKRGDKIGTLGDSGVASGCRRQGSACAIVHMELNTDGQGHPTALEGTTFDVLMHSAGCLDPTTSYPNDKLVLTHPVRCRNMQGQ